jgi:hypothetical protein
MSRNASGTYSLPLAAVIAGNTITASWANTSLSDIETELTDSLSRSGKGGLSASIPSDVGCTGTFNPEGDVSAADPAAVGQNAIDGLVLTGQGSTGDVTIKNDANATVAYVPTGTTNLDVVGDLVAGTITADGDTSAGDKATIGYTATEGLILTGQGGTNDVTIKNDADATVVSIPTGTTGVTFAGTINSGAITSTSTINSGAITSTGAIQGTNITATGTFTATGGQIAFPATQVPSSDVNTLDDYQEGTWSPVLSDGTNSATMDGTVTEAWYVKIGKLVTIGGNLGTSSLGSVSGSLRVTGLPFTVSSNNGASAGIGTGDASGFAITAGQSVDLCPQRGTTYMSIQLNDNAVGTTSMQHTEWSSDGALGFSGSYIV